MGVLSRPVSLTTDRPLGLWQILIVEDDDLVAGSTVAVLEELGYGVAGLAATAEDAFALVCRVPVDLALIDMHISGEQDGLSLAGKLRSMGIPFIIVTGAWSERLAQLNSATGRPVALLKPYSLATLRDALAKALSSD